MRWVRFLIFFLGSTLALVAGQAVLSADFLADRDLYLAGTTNPISIYARLFESAAGPAAPRTTRNLAFVLDRSGSMTGARIDALRKAVSLAVNSLSDEDVVSIVFFGSEIETVVEARRKDQLDSLEAQLAAIEPAGGSALYDALNQGAALLRRNLAPTSVNHLILVTDGPATKGPREAADFTRLAELFAREGITLSTFGIGEDFEEDRLAEMARIGNGEFRFAEKPEALLELLPAEVNALQRIVARDVTLKIEFAPFCDKIESYAWARASIQGQVISYTLPYVCAGRELRVLTQASAQARRFSSKIATLRMTWKDPRDDQTHEMVKTVEADFTGDLLAVQRATNPIVARVIAEAMARGGLEDAIVQLDKNSPPRALRALRHTREELFGLNYRLDDPAIESITHQFESFLETLRTRALTSADRKILRSGIYHQFGVPTAEDASPP